MNSSDSDRVLINQREEEVIEIDENGVVHPIGTNLKSVVLRDPEGELGLTEREVLGDECAIDGCPYAHKGDSKYCGLNHVCEDCGSQLLFDDIGYCTCKPCFDKKYAASPDLLTEVAEAMDNDGCGCGTIIIIIILLLIIIHLLHGC